MFYMCFLQIIFILNFLDSCLISKVDLLQTSYVTDQSHFALLDIDIYPSVGSVPLHVVHSTQARHREVKLSEFYWISSTHASTKSLVCCPSLKYLSSV
jgi:hypothetical protein